MAEHRTDDRTAQAHGLQLRLEPPCRDLQPELLPLEPINLDMINIGAYVPGSNPEIDLALEMNQPIRSFLQQSIDERCTLEQSFSQLDRLAGKARPAQPGL